MKEQKFYKLTTIVLIVINIGTLCFFWFTKPPHPGPPPQEESISAKLDLTGANKLFVDSLEKIHHSEKRRLMEKSREIKKGLYQLVGIESAKIDEMHKQLADVSIQIDLMTFDFFDEIADKCDEAQLKELKKLINHAILSKGPPPPPPSR